MGVGAGCGAPYEREAQCCNGRELRASSEVADGDSVGSEGAKDVFSVERIQG